MGFHLRLLMNSAMSILAHVFGEHMFTLLLGMLQGAELLRCKVYICLASEATAQWFCKVVVPAYSPSTSSRVWAPPLFYFFPNA